MPHYGQEEIYEMNKVGDTYELWSIYRVLGYRIRGGPPVVRHERYWQPVYDEKQLKKFIKIKRRMRGAKFLVNGVPLTSSFKPKPFVKLWEKSVGRYNTFGPGGI